MKRHGFFSPRRFGGFWDYALDPAVMLSVFALVLSIYGMCACDTYDPPGLAPAECTALVCDHLPGCSPIVMRSWDWRTREACRDTMRCGAHPDECVGAVERLVCIGPGATPELDAVHARGVRAIVEACAGVVGSGLGDGSGVFVEVKR